MRKNNINMQYTCYHCQNRKKKNIKFVCGTYTHDLTDFVLKKACMRH